MRRLLIIISLMLLSISVANAAQVKESDIITWNGSAWVRVTKGNVYNAFTTGIFPVLAVGGGYGSTGATIAATGNISTNGTLAVDGATTLSSTVVGPAADSVTYMKRAHIAIATVNSGTTLLAAKTGLKYRVGQIYMIAVGGSVTSSTATGIAISGTQSSSTVVLMTVAKASLTHSTPTAMTTAANQLADAASFAPCDANTAVTIAAAGGTDLAGATYIDVIVYYAIEN